jgi:hypothetical protein
VVYVRAYIELTRLLAQYEVSIHDHTCEDYVYETEGQTEKLLEGKIVKMTTTVTTYTHKLEAYRVRIEAAYRLQVQLRTHIVELTTQCGELDATVSSLDKVRDAIMVMGVCPGLGRLTFNIPEYTNQMLTESFNSTQLTDEEIDTAMNALCANSPPDNMGLLQTQKKTSPIELTYVLRAAETSEIMLRSIEGMPSTNTAEIPLMGTCPNCAGDDDTGDVPIHVSGHFRVCWDPSARLAQDTKRTDCTAGRKAVMCVREQTYPQSLGR